MIEPVCCPFNVYMSASANVSLAWCLFQPAAGHFHSNSLCPSFFFVYKQIEGSWGFSFHWPLRRSGEAARGSLTFMPPALTMQHSLATVNKVAQYVIRRAASSLCCRGEKKKQRSHISWSWRPVWEAPELCAQLMQGCGGVAGSYSSSQRAVAGLNPGPAGGLSQFV